MNTRLDTDPELLDLVRAADPMLDPRVQVDAGLDTELALRLLALELDRPPAPRRARRRRSALRIAVLVGVVAAAVFAVANVASTGNDSAVPSAQAQTILRHSVPPCCSRPMRSTNRMMWARSPRATGRDPLPGTSNG